MPISRRFEKLTDERDDLQREKGRLEAKVADAKYALRTALGDLEE